MFWTGKITFVPKQLYLRQLEQKLICQDFQIKQNITVATEYFLFKKGESKCLNFVWMSENVLKT